MEKINFWLLALGYILGIGSYFIGRKIQIRKITKKK